MGFYQVSPEKLIYPSQREGAVKVETCMRKNRVQISGYRYYSPRLGRWLTRDPLEMEPFEGCLYSFLKNNTVNSYDILGLFGAGYPGGPGHGDFPGSSFLDACYGFDYNAEDRDWMTLPFFPWGIGHHFRTLDEVQQDIRGMISSCDSSRFERLMHQGQDFFSHYKNGWRWHPTLKYLYPIPGHPPAWWPGNYPDDDDIAFADAFSWTLTQLFLWDQNCCKHLCDCRWVKRGEGLCSDE